MLKDGYQTGDVRFVPLSDVKKSKLIDLMNNEGVRRNLPLLTGYFSEKACQAFLAKKQEHWIKHGLGPWAFIIRDEFAGWGGLQIEQGEVDVALVLHPKFWGAGKIIFSKIKDEAFNQMELDSITALLPPCRSNSKAITRLGFIEEAKVVIGQETFIRYRLTKS